MTVQPSHTAGAAGGLALGAILAGILSRYGVVTLTPAEYTLIGAAFVGAGAGLVHALWNIGVGPVLSRILHGPKPAPVATVTVPVAVSTPPPVSGA